MAFESRFSLVRASALALTLLVAGCGGGSSSLDVFDLTAPAGARGGGGRALVVAEPAALQFLDSERIVVRAKNQVSLLPGAQWSDKLPRLLQSRIIQTLENQGRSVARPGDRVTVAYQLVAEVRTFEISADSNEAVVSISAKLVAETGGRIVGSRLFSAREPVGAIDAGTAPAALDRALGRVLLELAQWAR